jgi:signal transduction histidine kinase
MLRVIVVGITAVTVVVTLLNSDLRQGAFAGLQAFAFIAAPYWWATSVRQKTELAELAAGRADDLVRLAGLREAALLDNERSRMARDLHDVIAGHLSAVAIHSEAALSRAPHQDADRAALRSIRTSSVSSLAEMRTMIDLLRAGADPVSATGGVDRLPQFIDAARAAGLTVEFDPRELEALPPLPAAIDQAASRVLQEAITNASKHATGGELAVRLSATRDTLHLEIESAARDAAAAPPTSGGFGLLTMGERAQILGGRLSAGWLDEHTGRWLVSADLPLERAS